MKANISKFLRQTKLLYTADKLRFFLARYKNKENNSNFQLQNPDFKFPSDYLMYESFNLNYESYYSSGEAAACFMLEIFKKYNGKEDVNILDWGCGPARIVRHIPKIISENSEVFATDYNEKSIEWNKKNIDNVIFNLNGIEAKLPYQDNFFDFIYGISIFTHLSKKLHYDWKQELSRVLKKDGILLLSLQGDLFKTILTASECKKFEQGNIIVRGDVKDGHRTYSAFHPNEFVKNLFSDFEVLEHTPSHLNNGSLEQDVWVFSHSLKS